MFGDDVMDSPLPHRYGPYEAISIMGSGGMGTVYTARHVETRVEVAVKALKARTDVAMRCMRGEIEALKQIQHSGVVKILEHGVVDGQPWYAMEIIHGSNLQDVLAGGRSPGFSDSHVDGGDNPITSVLPATLEQVSIHTQVMVAEQYHSDGIVSPESRAVASSMNDRVRDALGFVAKMCHVLKFLHGEGIVHGDLKPSNVMIDEAGCVKLVDFGLVARLGTRVGGKQIAAAADCIGTVGYMAPERLRLRDFDARSDLYAVGSILYNVLTGRKLSRELAEQFDLDWTPGLRGSEVPGEMDSLIARLLRPEPRDRPGHVLEVLGVLKSIGVDTEDPYDTPWRPYLYVSPLHGRNKLIRDLARWGQQSTSLTSMTVLSGASGSGKSRIVLEVIRRFGQRGFPVQAGTCRPESEEGVLLRPFSQMIRGSLDRISIRHKAEPVALLGACRVLVPLMPFLADVVSIADSTTVASDAPSREQVFRALGTLLRQLSDRDELLICIDDLQWADSLTLEAIEFLVGDTSGRPSDSWKPTCSVIATLRRDEISPPIARLLEHDHVAIQSVDLLGVRDVHGMICDMLGGHVVPPGLMRTIESFAMGNPFFVGACMRALIDAGALLLNNRGEWEIGKIPDVFAFPDELISVLARRLDILSDASRALCEVASAFGRSTELRVLEEVSGIEGAAFDRAVDELSRRNILVWAERDDQTVLEFSHDQLLELAYRSLGVDHARRMDVHTRIATVLASRTQARLDAGRVALHWDRAGKFAEASDAYLEAFQQAVRCFAHNEAEDFFLRGIALREGDDEISLRTTIEFISQVYDRNGRLKEAEEWAMKVETKGRSIGSRYVEAKALRILGSVRAQLGRLEAGYACLRDAADMFSDIGDAAALADTLHKIGLIHWWKDECDEAYRFCVEALEYARSAEDTIAVSTIVGTMGLIKFRLKDFDSATAFFEEAVQICQDRGHLRGKGLWWGHIAEVHRAKGEYASAGEYLQRAIEVSRDVCDKRREAGLVVCLARLQRLRGELTEARAILSKVFEDIRQGDHHESVGDYYCELGHIALAAGRSVDDKLAAARRAAGRLGIGEESDLALSIRRLERARDANARGERLYHGQCLGDFPAVIQADFLDAETLTPDS
jgi:serine/threonine protein kinase/tetratricopeptide (TPR) repeat protein